MSLIYNTLIAGKRRLALVKQGVFSNLLQIIDAGHAFIVIPLAINYVGIEGFGWWVTSYGIVQILLLMDGGLSNVFQSRLTNAFSNDNYYLLNSTLSVILMFTFGITFILFLISIPYISLAKYIFGSEFINVIGIEMGLMLSVVAGLLAIANGNLGIIGSASLNPQIIFVPAIISRLIGLVVTICLFNFDFGILSIPIGILLSESLCLANCTYRIYKIGFKYVHPDRQSWDEWKKILRLTFFAKLCGGAYNGMEPALIGYFIGPSYSAIYIASKKPATLIVKFFYSLWASSLSPLISYMATQSYDGLVYRLSFFYAFVLRLSFVAFFFYIILNEHFLRLWIGSIDIADWRLFTIISILIVTELAFNVINESFLIINLPRLVAINFILILVVRISLGIPAAFIFGFYGFLVGIAFANIILSAYIWFNLCKSFNGVLSFSKVIMHLSNLWIYISLIFAFIVLNYLGFNLFAFNLQLMVMTVIFVFTVIFLEFRSLVYNFGLIK